MSHLAKEKLFFCQQKHSRLLSGTRNATLHWYSPIVIGAKSHRVIIQADCFFSNRTVLTFWKRFSIVIIQFWKSSSASSKVTPRCSEMERRESSSDSTCSSGNKRCGRGGGRGTFMTVGWRLGTLAGGRITYLPIKTRLFWKLENCVAWRDAADS